MGRPKTNDAGYADFTNPQPSRNTLVIITSDNGGASKDEGNFSNALLRGSKGSVFEGGIRVPLYAYWIGKTLRGIQNNSLLRSSDLISTLVELAGGKYETITEGESFAPILKTRKSRLITRNKPMFWHQREQIKFCGNIDEFIRNGEWKKDPYRQAVRDGNWKFVSDYETDRQREYLFNFANSESEENFANVISSFRQKANEMRSLINNMAIIKSHYIQSVDRVEGTALDSGENLLTFNSPGGRVILKPHDLNESHDGSYTYAIRVKPTSRAIGRTSVLAQRTNSWVIRLLSNGRIQLVVFDDKSKERVYLTSTTALTANNDYNIAFTITGHTGNSNVTRKPGCVESTFINNVARLYVFPTSSDRVPDPEDNNATDIYNVAVSGYSNPIHFGNSERSNQPFFGKIKIMGGYSLSLNKDQLKIAFDPNL